MKAKIGYMANDVVLYSKGLDKAIKENNISEAKKYIKKINDQLTMVKKYLKVKDQLNNADQYGIKKSKSKS